MKRMRLLGLNHRRLRLLAIVILITKGSTNDSMAEHFNHNIFQLESRGDFQRVGHVKERTSCGTTSRPKRPRTREANVAGTAVQGPPLHALTIEAMWLSMEGSTVRGLAANETGKCARASSGQSSPTLLGYSRQAGPV